MLIAISEFIQEFLDLACGGQSHFHFFERLRQADVSLAHLLIKQAFEGATMGGAMLVNSAHAV